MLGTSDSLTSMAFLMLSLSTLTFMLIRTSPAVHKPDAARLGDWPCLDPTASNIGLRRKLPCHSLQGRPSCTEYALESHRALACSLYAATWDSNIKLGSTPTLLQRSVLPAAGAWAKLDIWIVLIYGYRKRYGPAKLSLTGLCPGHVRPAIWWLSRQGGVLKLGILGTANFQVLVDEISTHNFDFFFCTNLTSSHANVKQGQNLVPRTVFIATTFSATRIDDFLGFVLNTPFLSHSPGCNATNCVRRTGLRPPHRGHHTHTPHTHVGSTLPTGTPRPPTMSTHMGPATGPAPTLSPQGL